MHVETYTCLYLNINTEMYDSGFKFPTTVEMGLHNTALITFLSHVMVTLLLQKLVAAEHFINKAVAL